MEKMNRNRRETTEQRTLLGNVISGEGQRSQVEIIDDEDDEVEEIHSQGTTASHNDRNARLRTRRQRREAEELQFSNDDGIDDEWDHQMQQVLLMSKIEAEKQEERRKMCGTLQDVMNLQVEIEPLSSIKLKSLAKETRNMKDVERDQREDTSSPELFSTPPEEQEQLASSNEAAQNIESDQEIPNSPSLPVTMRSPDAVPSDKDEKLKENLASTEPLERQEKGGTRRKLKLRRTRQEESSQADQKDNLVSNELKVSTLETDEEELQSGNSKDVALGEKRKLEPDDDDVTDDEDSIPMMTRRVSLKRKKLSIFDENSDTDDLQELEKKGSKWVAGDPNDPQPKRIAVDEHDQQGTTSSENSPPKGKDPVADTRQQRTPSSLLHVRLSRWYKKSRCRPSTLKEAMKADLYFAPPGFDFSAYTLLIIRMFENYRQRLHVAQSKVKTLVPWGSPVVCGKMQGKTLDVQLPGKASTFLGERSSAFVRGTPREATSCEVKPQLEKDVFNRRRTLRSSVNLQSKASTSTSTTTRGTLPSFKVDSDSDCEDLMTSFLDKVIPSSVNTSTKKTQRSVKNDSTSNGVFVEACKLKTQAPEEPSVTTQTARVPNMGVSDDDRSSNYQFDRPFNEKTATGDHGIVELLFGADVVLDSKKNEVQSNVLNSSVKVLGKGNEEINKSTSSENKLEGENSVQEGEGLSEANADTDGNQSDFIQPPKRRSIVRLLDDDSTDDEGNLSQPVFSLHLPTKEASADCEMPSSKEDNITESTMPIGEGNDEVILDDVVPLDSPSLMTQSESQGNLGKSILETMATNDETLLPSQALSEAGSVSHKLITEIIEDSSNYTSSSSSAVRPTAKRGAEGFTGEEQLTIDVDSDNSRHLRQMRSDVAEKAAAAAMKRQQGTSKGQELREACSSSSTMNKPEELTKHTQEDYSTVECPLCYQHFTLKEIEAHASDCEGPPSSPQLSYSQSHRAGPSMSSSASKPKSTIYQTLTGQRGELKNMKVVLQRSPLAKEKLPRKANQLTDSAKRNLDFTTDLRPSESLDQYARPLASGSRSFDQGSRTHGRINRAALRTETEVEYSGYENDGEDSSSQVYSWLDSSSPEKKKPQQTYKGNASKQCEDYIPLETQKESEDYGVFTRNQHDSKQACSRTEEIESDSDSSGDDSLMVQCGTQRTSPRLKTQPRHAETAGMDENELALNQLGGRCKKRPLSSSKTSKAKKPRRPSDQSSSEDSDGLTIVCGLCNKKIPKELYDQHAEEELEEKRRLGRTPKNKDEEVVTVKEKKRESSKPEQRRLVKRVKPNEDTPSQSSGTEYRDTDQNEDEIDWDAVSDSPIKCFQFTENSTSGVDFENQFKHVKETTGNRRRGNQRRYQGSGTRGGYGQSDTRGEFGKSGTHGGYEEFGNRGRGRGSYNKVYGRGRGKKYRGRSKGNRRKK